MSTREIDELFTRALTGDYEDEGAWEAVRELHKIGSREVLEWATRLCKSPDSLSRTRGADVLGQLGRTIEHRENTFPEESFAALTDLVRRETESQTLGAGITALGHLGNPLAIPLIASFSSHPGPKIRFDATFALGCFPNEPLSVETLLRLAEDEDEDIRDWAVFGFGVLGESDSAAIREVLVRRLGDSYEEAREEAIAALGKRKDERVLPSLLAELERADVTVRAIEAADFLLGTEYEREDWTRGRSTRLRCGGSFLFDG